MRPCPEVVNLSNLKLKMNIQEEHDIDNKKINCFFALLSCCTSTNLSSLSRNPSITNHEFKVAQINNKQSSQLTNMERHSTGSFPSIESIPTGKQVNKMGTKKNNIKLFKRRLLFVPEQ